MLYTRLFTCTEYTWQLLKTISYVDTLVRETSYLSCAGCGVFGDQVNGMSYTTGKSGTYLQRPKI